MRLDVDGNLDEKVVGLASTVEVLANGNHAPSPPSVVHLVVHFGKHGHGAVRISLKLLNKIGVAEPPVRLLQPDQGAVLPGRLREGVAD